MDPYAPQPMDEPAQTPLIDTTGLATRLRHIAAERDWEQFHTPRNLAMALAGEVGEVLAEMQWLTDQQVLSAAPTDAVHQRISAEVADVLVYLVRLGDVLGIDLDDAVRNKLAEVEARYRPDDIRGSAAKR
jgi:NTP pyrophosphatase (non-canonical NTP hydrolase)